MRILDFLCSSIVFWMSWIIIPLLVEILPAIGGFFILVKKKIVQKPVEPITNYPEICIIIPVYNSADTLKSCIASIYHSTYPRHLMRIYLIHNEGQDNSFEVFQECQREFPELMMQWLNSKQGKAKALNLALYNSEGKYIIHIDSDGRLQENALKNMVNRFESDSEIGCMTGVILTDQDLIGREKSYWKRLLQRLEFCEYAQAFLSGRNFDSELNSIFTLSGAFSAFRKSTILKSQLYHTGTVSEDTQVTFQVRFLLKQRIYLCENAIFLSEPISGINQLYTQRQRWQRGEIEVSRLFFNKRLPTANLLARSLMFRTLLYDHTFAFPRMIWYFALGCLVFKNYSMRLIIFSLGLIFGLYIISAYLYYFSIIGYLSGFPEIKKYYRKCGFLIALLPFFNFMIFWIRLAGIINSIDSKSSWRTKNLTEEGKAAIQETEKMIARPLQWLYTLRGFVNVESEKNFEE